MSDADCTPGRESRSIAASQLVSYLLAAVTDSVFPAGKEGSDVHSPW